MEGIYSCSMSKDVTASDQITCQYIGWSRNWFLNFSKQENRRTSFGISRHFVSYKMTDVVGFITKHAKRKVKVFGCLEFVSPSMRPVLQIRSDPDLFAGSGSGKFTTKSGSGSNSGSLNKNICFCAISCICIFIYSVDVIH